MKKTFIWFLKFLVTYVASYAILWSTGWDMDYGFGICLLFTIIMMTLFDIEEKI